MIKKAILPVAGLGTRFLPASKSIPKEMVTVVDRPAIEYVVREAVEAGIEQIILVTHSSKASIENYFDRLTGLSSQVGLAGRHFSVEGSFHLIEVLDPLNLTKREAIKRQYVGHGEAYTLEVPKRASLEGEYYGKEIVWSCTSNDRDENEVLPEPSGDDKVKFEIPKVNSSYEVIADKPLESGAVRVIYNTTRYMKKLPKEAKLTPQVENKTRHTDDYENEIEAGKHNVKSPYPLVYDHEDNDSKELEQYEFDHWDYRNKDGKWQECGAGDSISDLINNNARQPITLYAAWRKVSNQNRKQVQFYICKSAMPEDGSVALPTTNVDDYTSAVAVANCNVKASILHDVPVLGNKNPSTWEQYADGNKRVQELLQGTKPDEGYIGNGDYIYKIDRIPSDEEVFQTIRESGRMIRIGDREIPPSKLDTEFFTIYWYSFKSEMSDGWHIDGRIVAKNGYLTVKKDFVGMPEAIEEVKKDYYIQVDMDEKLLDGKPQPPAFHEHMKLVLPSEDSQKPDAEAPQAEDAPIEVVGTWTDDTHTSCTWIVKADSFWKYTLKEYNYKPKDSNVKFSGWYNVRNSHEQGDNVNSWEAYPESGIQFTGRGIGRGGETLTIELENRYQKEGILTLNKFDESTGQGMEKINFAVSKNGVEEETVTTDKYGIAQLHIPLQDENKQNRTATETYLLRETNLPTGYVDTGDIQITVEIANGAFKITDAKLVDREANENQEAVKAPVDGKIDGKSVLFQRGDTSLNIRNFAKTIGIAKRDNLIDVSLLEFCVREDLNKIAPRVMAVLDPVKLVITNYPEGQEFYKGGYMKFYEDAHDFVKNNNIQPCENPDEVYLMKVLVNPDGKVNYVQDPDVMGVKNNKCAFDFGKKILANLNDYVPAEVDGVKTPALTRIIFYPKELFADSNYIPLNSSLIDAEFPGGISNYRKKFISCVEELFVRAT